MTKKAKGRRPSMGNNPLDTVLSPQKATKAPPGTSKKAQAKKRPQRPTSIRATFHLDESLVEELRNAAVYLAGPPEHASLSGIVRNALRKELDRLRRKHLDGGEIPKRTRDPKGGRPVGT